MKTEGDITDMFQEYGLYGDFCITKKGTMIGGIILDGRDPDGLSNDDLIGLSLIARTFYQKMPDTLRCITQYYVHCDGIEISLKERESPVSQYLSTNRQNFLNTKKMSGSRLVHLFEINPEENIAEQSLLTYLKHIGLAIKSKKSRMIIADSLSTEKTIKFHEECLIKQNEALLDIIEDVKSRWDSIFNCRKMNKNQLWAFCRFLADMDKDLLDVHEDVPVEEWDVLLAEGDRYPVTIKDQEYMKFQNVKNQYCRILSVTRFSEDVGNGAIVPGLWGAKTHAPIRQKGNYIIMTRYSPLTRLKQAIMFKSKKNELYRKNMDFMSVLSGRAESNAPQNGSHVNLKPAISQKMQELEEVEGLSENWGHMHSSVVIFGDSPEQITETTKNLRKSLIHSGMSVVVENADMPDSYKTILPAGRENAIRNIEINTTQLGALSLIYKQAEGQITVRDLRGEEAQYIFQSADGSPFYFSPFCGERCVVIGVGPIRSGKSFTKNTLAGHSLKYGGAYRAIDIDAGTEPLAQFFREEGAIFRIGQGTRGFNSFKAVAKGPEDYSFINHQRNLVLEMIKANDNEDMRHIDSHEQQSLDDAIISTLRLPERLRSFTSMVNHLPIEFQKKLSRWHGDGYFANIFDQNEDAIGSIDNPVVAFNLLEVKDDPILLPLCVSEITYRVTRMFEDPKYINVPKYLDIDEAHVPLKIDYYRDFLIRYIRTSGKYMAGIGLWSQDPSEFLNVPDWSALRSAASTLFFMADPTLDESLYKKTFSLTDGELAAIRELRPKREAYIIQRDIGVSKKILLEVEPEQYVICTSTAYERDLRNTHFKKYGVFEGIQKTIELLNLDERKERATA